MPYSDSPNDRPLLADSPDDRGEGQTPWQDSRSPQRGNSGSDVPDASMADSDEFHIRSISPQPMESTSTLPLPLWLREASPSFKWAWIPLPLRRTGRFVAEWTKGPKQPQIQRITPWFPLIQEFPLRLVKRFLPKRWHKASALLMVYLAWALTFSLVIRDSARSGDVRGYGVPEDLWCGASLWGGAKSCGLDGNNCRPFTNASMAFRCNANCAGMRVLNPYPVGNQTALYTPFVVGGPPSNSSSQDARSFYRADSFICQAAVHAGVVSDKLGGCGILHLTGARGSFAASTSNTIESYGFESYFPKSYTFSPTSVDECGVVDMRWPLLGVTLAFTIVLSLFVSSPAVFFASIFTMLFFHVGFVSDKPNIASYAELASVMLGRFLPTAFTALALYRFAVRPQLGGLTAQVEKTVLWLGGVWVGSLSNYTLDFIPISRLTPEDLKQPGAVLSLILICALIFAIALGQVHYLRQEGLLRRYLLIYATMVLTLLFFVALPTHHLRIHHYILALLLLPGTRPQTRPGMLYQGLLMGLFINGTARWGFDSILQTAAALRVGGSDGPQFDSLLPKVTAAVGWYQGTARNLTLSWNATTPEGYDGLSVVVNDVERHRWYVGEGAPVWAYSRTRGQSRWWRGQEPESKEFFRFAYMSGSEAQDYTSAGIWEVGGNWTEGYDGTS